MGCRCRDYFQVPVFLQIPQGLGDVPLVQVLKVIKVLREKLSQGLWLLVEVVDKVCPPESLTHVQVFREWHQHGELGFFHLKECLTVFANDVE